MKKKLMEMPLAWQVCSREQGEELEKLGVKTRSQMVWVLKNDMKWKIITYDEYFDSLQKLESKFFSKLYSKVHQAYSGDELGVLLPFCINIGKKTLYHKIIKTIDNQFVSIYSYSGFTISDFNLNPTEAIAKADTFIKIIREGYIKTEDVYYRSLINLENAAE